MSLLISCSDTSARLEQSLTLHRRTGWVCVWGLEVEEGAACSPGVMMQSNEAGEEALYCSRPVHLHQDVKEDQEAATIMLLSKQSNNSK